MLLGSVVETSDIVAATRSRKAKIDAIASLLRACEPGEVPTVVCFLTGEPRQGRIGVGWRTLADARREAADPEADRPSTVTVAELDVALDQIQATTGPGSAGARRQQLAELFARTTASEADFVFRLLTGELRQGALAGVMADAVARAADVPLSDVRRAAMLGGDLAETARRALEGGAAALADVGLVVLRPVQPMLAATAPGVAEALDATGPASVEWKLDGARIQVHRAGDDVRVFTRNLNDVTARVPEVVEIARSLPAPTFLIDGEAIGLSEDALPRRFQDTMSRFGTDGAHEMTLAAFFFDVLHVDGDDVIDRPLRERAPILRDLVGEWRVPAVETDDVAVADAFLSDALATGHEGVMVKSLDAPYEAGRRGATWRKVKPVQTLDLVVLAAEWGHGRRRGWLSNIHLGARDPESGGFVMVGKTFKGMTDELLAWQTARFQELAIERGDYAVRVAPQLVVEIALDGVQASTRYPGGVALRFARVRGYRPDKNPSDADTIDAVRALLAP